MIQSLTNILGDPTPFSYQIPGYKTGYPSLDDLLGGISTSGLLLLASKTGNWGSNLMLNLAIGLSKRYRVLLIQTTKNAAVVAGELRSVLLPEDGTPENDEQLLDELNQTQVCSSSRRWYPGKRRAVTGRIEPFGCQHFYRR
ncbi:MAG: hypothetical protein NTW16_00010 [Bacteroidetes bacterium]|nr:hypothetical protein [Bacteroidota bacterium]